MIREMVQCCLCKLMKMDIQNTLKGLSCRECYIRDLEDCYKAEKRKRIILPELNRITDKIYIGNSDAGRDLKLLKSNGITHILVLGTYLFSFFPDEFTYKTIEIEDNDSENITSHFNEAFEFIESGDKVLIHCFAGKSRSPSFAVAYLMYKSGRKYSEVYSFVKNKRKVVEINNGFKKALIDFNSILSGA